MSDPKKDAKRDVIRRQVFMKNVPDFAEKAGLEIGALCAPLLQKSEANVKYYDIFPKETLIEHFQEFYPGRTFVDVDFVARTRSLSEVLGDNKFDYFIANHVVEHIPDFIGFFKAVCKCLNDGGKFFLAIPDRRFTFDYNRPETSAGHLIVDHEDHGTVDAAEHILDSLIYHTEKLNVYWSDIENQRYNFVHHHHIFNYENFIDRIIKPLIRLRYFPFSVIDCHFEPDLDNEFNIVLEKCTDLDKIHVLGEHIEVQPEKYEEAPNLYDFRAQMDLISKSGSIRSGTSPHTLPSGSADSIPSSITTSGARSTDSTPRRASIRTTTLTPIPTSVRLDSILSGITSTTASTRDASLSLKRKRTPHRATGWRNPPNNTHHAAGFCGNRRFSIQNRTRSADDRKTPRPER